MTVTFRVFSHCRCRGGGASVTAATKDDDNDDEANVEWAADHALKETEEDEWGNDQTAAETKARQAAAAANEEPEQA